MAIVINQLMLDKLVHEIQEIRLRTLLDIKKKLKRAIYDREEIKFSPPALFKNLIRWFGQDPLCEEMIVLETMLLLVSNKYVTEIIQFFSAERIIKEMNKINVLIGKDQDFARLITVIIERVDASNASRDQDIDSIDLSDVQSTFQKMDLDRISASSRRQAAIDSLESRWKDKKTLYTECWETQSSSVENLLDSFNDSLLMEEDETNFELALSYVIPYTKDFPADFFLRPPYLCLSLFRLIRLRKVDIRTGCEMLLYLVESLKKRVTQRSTVALCIPPEGVNEKTQISTSALVYEMYHLAVELLKETSTATNLESSNMVFMLLENLTTFSLEGACSLMQNFPVERFVEVRSDLGFLLKYFRQEWESNSKNVNSRTRYRMVLHSMVNFVEHWKTLYPKIPTIFPKVSQKARSYNASDYATMNSTGHQQALDESDDIWMHEMHLALLDYPLSKMCTTIYHHLVVLTANYKEDIPRIRVLGDIPYPLESVVELLRAGAGALDMSADELLAIGPDAVKTMFLHRSFGLLRMIMNAVGKCATSITEDAPMWESLESIMVRLLSERDEEIRCEVYSLCTEMMKEFIGQLDECAVLTRRNMCTNLSSKLRAAGIPLSLQIITEIICFGYTSTNSKIRHCAETILLFVCNMKLLLQENWYSVEEILLSAAPLLQTAAVGMKETKLRKAILGMFHPDFGLPWLDMLQGNLRLLFHEDSHIRTEALPRVLFLLSTVQLSETRLWQRIDLVRDTIPNELCLVNLPYDPRRQQMVDVYEASSVRPLLDMLEQEGGDPAIRRSTLQQLNAMAEDPVLCELIHSSFGWMPVMKALCNALQDDHSYDYPDTAIPAIGILTKICFNVVTFRRFLSTNDNAYHMIVRALLSFFDKPVFRVECCALLYLLIFADYATGTGAMISLPALCRSSSFKVPFVCQYHWQHSPFQQVNVLDVLLNGRSTGGSALELDCGGDSILRIEERSLLQDVATIADGTAEESHGRFSVSQSSTYQECLMRYIRFVFADIWFGGLDNVLKAIKHHKRSDSEEHQLAPIEYNGRVVGTKPFQFNSALRLTKQDIRWLKAVDNASTIRKAMRRIVSATAHAEVYRGLATLEGNMFFPVNSKPCLPEQQMIIDTLQRYFVSPPGAAADQQLLIAVLNTVGNLIDLEQYEIRDWAVTMLMTGDGNIFLKLFRSKATGVELYAKTARFLRVVLSMAPPCSDGPPPGKGTAVANWEIEVFRGVFAQMRAEIKAANFPRVLALASLLEVAADLVANKSMDKEKIILMMLEDIRKIQPAHYNAASVIRSSLITMRKLLNDTEITLNRWQFKLLLVLCGHSCRMIRACGWNVLSRLAVTASCAEVIVENSEYLPGEIHGSCISTLLDKQEACLVRESVACLLVNLFSHLITKEGVVRKKMLPRNPAFNSPTADPARPLQPLETMLLKMKFFEGSASLLERYTQREFFIEGHFAAIHNGPVVSADLVKAFTLVYRSLLEMETCNFLGMLIEKGCIKGLLHCIIKCPLSTTSDPQLSMVAEVCALLTQCNAISKHKEVVRMLMPNPLFFRRIIALLEPARDCNDDTKNAMCKAKVNIMQLVNELVVFEPQMMRIIRSAFETANIKGIVEMISEAIQSEMTDLQIGCFDFLSIHLADAAEFANSPLLKRLDALNDDARRSKQASTSETDDSDEVEKEQVKDPNTGNTNPNQSTETHTGPPEGSTAQHSGSGSIFKQLLDLFIRTNKHAIVKLSMDMFAPHKVKTLCAMQVMLRVSHQSRTVAWERGLLPVLIDCFNRIYTDCLLGQSHSEFARKNGETKTGLLVLRLIELFRTLSSWFSHPPESGKLHQDQINALCRVCLQYWSWMSCNGALERIFLETLTVLSTDSVPVCQAFATTFTGFSHSIVKLLIVKVTAQTARIKGPKSEVHTLSIALRVLMHCCSCQEGRSMISKLHLLDNINKLHPSVTKMHKPWPEVTRLWLDFWGYYSHYEDGREVKHLTVLGALVRRSDLDLRHNAMAIIRNLTFSPANRPALLASSDYMFMLQNSLNRTAKPDEQLMAAVTVWKLIANNHKGRAAIKASPLVRHIAALVNYHMTAEPQEQRQLWDALMTVYRILQE